MNNNKHIKYINEFLFLIQFCFCSPGIKICAYTVPHPAENKIHFNIQTTGESAIEVLKRGFQDLEKICDHTLETFDIAYKKFKSSDVPMNTM